MGHLRRTLRQFTQRRSKSQVTLFFIPGRCISRRWPGRGVRQDYRKKQILATAEAIQAHEQSQGMSCARRGGSAKALLKIRALGQRGTARRGRGQPDALCANGRSRRRCLGALAGRHSGAKRGGLRERTRFFGMIAIQIGYVQWENTSERRAMQCVQRTAAICLEIIAAKCGQTSFGRKRAFQARNALELQAMCLLWGGRITNPRCAYIEGS